MKASDQLSSENWNLMDESSAKSSQMVTLSEPDSTSEVQVLSGDIVTMSETHHFFSHRHHVKYHRVDRFGMIAETGINSTDDGQ